MVNRYHSHGEEVPGGRLAALRSEVAGRRRRRKAFPHAQCMQYTQQGWLVGLPLNTPRLDYHSLCSTVSCSRSERTEVGYSK